MFSSFIVLVLIAVSGYFIFKYAYKAWHEADVDDKLEDVQVTHEQYEKVKDVDTKEFKKEQKKVNKILDL